MMKAAVGSRLKVTGSKSATVSAGPIPGSTPTAVPSETPTSAQNRLNGVIATAKPWPSAASVSMPKRPPSCALLGAGSDQSSAPSAPAGRARPKPRVKAT